MPGFDVRKTVYVQVTQRHLKMWQEVYRLTVTVPHATLLFSVYTGPYRSLLVMHHFKG